MPPLAAASNCTKESRFSILEIFTRDGGKELEGHSSKAARVSPRAIFSRALAQLCTHRHQFRVDSRGFNIPAYDSAMRVLGTRRV